MPKQGQSVESCTIVEWLVAEGDVVDEGQPVCEIETDKAAFEVEAPAAGTVLGIFYPADSDVEVLKVIAAIGEPGEDISAMRPAAEDGEPATQAEPEPSPEKIEPAAPTEPETIETPSPGARPNASPRAASLAAMKGLDISRIAGTGPAGRVIERDVMAAKAAPVLTSPGPVATLPAVDTSISAPAIPGKMTEIPMKGVRKLVADRMYASLQGTAQLTHNASADARSVLNYRQICKSAPAEAGIGDVTINDFVLYATIRTLAEFPELNAHRLGDRIVQYADVHLGMAVDTERGLMVPVLHNANSMSLVELSREARRLATACREGGIDPDDLRGGTFTVTNLGALGVESFTPVLNAPEVGILGVCAIQARPVVKGADVEFIPHMGLSLTFDHCAVDGAPAARFLSSLKANIAAFDLTLLD